MSLKSIFIKHYPYINIIMNIFRVLIKETPYKILQKPGQKVVSDIENVFMAIMYKVKSGVQWHLLPVKEFVVSCSTSTVYNYFTRWCNNGLLKDIWIYSVKFYRKYKGIKFYRQSIDSTKIKAVKGGTSTGPNSTDRGRKGTKLHTLIDENGIPLSVIITAANVHDCIIATSLLDNAIIKKPSNRKRNSYLLADSAYDTKELKEYCRINGYTPIIPENQRKKKIYNLKKLTSFEKLQYTKRIKIENSYALLKNNRTHTYRYERKAEMFLGLTYIAFAFLIISKI